MVDVETGGLNPATDALLEVAVVMIKMDNEGVFHVGDTFAEHFQPFAGANISKDALEVNKIIPDHPFRYALPEKEGLEKLLAPINAEIKAQACHRAVLIGHNAWFDLHFLRAAIERSGLKNPFHNFSSFDTVSLGALAFGQTVLARICQKAKIPFHPDEAHSAIYDAQKTAEVFCHILNNYEKLR